MDRRVASCGEDGNRKEENGRTTGGWVGRSVISASSTTRINSLIKRINELQPGQSIHLSLFLATLLITCIDEMADALWPHDEDDDDDEADNVAGHFSGKEMQ